MASGKDSFDFFEEIYCINLDSEQERWLKVQSEFDKVGIRDRVQKFSAIKHDKYGYGCTYSHLEILKIAQKKKLNNVLILEDDFKISHYNPKVLQSALDSLKNYAYDVFYLGYNFYGSDFHVKRLSRHLILIAKGDDMRGAQATCYSYKGIKYVLEHFNNENFKIIDVWLREHLESYCLIPLLAYQDQRNKYNMFKLNFLLKYKTHFIWYVLKKSKVFNKYYKKFILYLYKR